MVANEPPQTDLGQQLVKELTAKELQETVENSSETYNLAQGLPEEQQREVGQEVHSGFEDDNESRTEWLSDHTFWLSLYMQADSAENSGSERSWGATESLPVLTESCDQFQTRTYKTFFPNDTFVSAIPMNRNKGDREALEERAERIGHHMSYQLGFKDRTYKQDKDALFLGVATHGSFFTKTYYSDRLKRFKVDNIRPTDLVVNYNVGPVRIENLRRKTHIIYTTVGETQDLVNSGYFIQPAMPAQYEAKTPYNVKVDETQGLTSTGSGKIKRDRPAVCLEQHFYLDLDGDNNFRPYIATICAASQKLLRLCIGYEADPMGMPLKDYEQIQYFTHYKFKENPDGFYGLGLGHSLGDLNSAMNIALRQVMDAATLANDGNMSGFISERLGLDGDEIQMVMGKYTKISDSVGSFKDSIMTMQFPGPNDALIKLMEMLDQRAQRLGSTTEATTGSPDRAEQPTTYLAEIEQAMETFSSVQMRLANSFSEELNKIYRINQRYLPLVDAYVVNDIPEMVTRADYADDMLIQPIFDPKFATQQQKVARAQAELQATLQNPNSPTRPQVFDAAFTRYLKALDVDNIEELIPAPPQPIRVDDQDAENMAFLQPAGKTPPIGVFPDQNHAEHLAKMEPFIATHGDKIPPEQQQAVMQHKQMHESFLYGQQKGLIPPSKTQPITIPPMATGPGYPVGNGVTEAPFPSTSNRLAGRIAQQG